MRITLTHYHFLLLFCFFASALGVSAFAAPPLNSAHEKRALPNSLFEHSYNEHESVSTNYSNAKVASAATSPYIETYHEFGTFTAVVGTQPELPGPYYWLDAYYFPPFEVVRITVSDPSGSFMISATGNAGDFGSTIEIATNSSGFLTTSIYVKYEPIASGNHVATISHSGGGAEPVSFTVEGNATNAEPMPVELVSFRADAVNNDVVLNWVTASEQDNSHFEVETTRALTDGFSKIGRVDSKNSNSSTLTKYSFKYPISKATGASYFRLKQVDLDGTYTYSKIIAFDDPVRTTMPEITIAPNPVTPSTQLSFTAAEPGLLRVKVLNMNGAVVYSQTYNVTSGENSISLGMYEKAPAGAYILTTEFKDKLSRSKLLKN